MAALAADAFTRRTGAGAYYRRGRYARRLRSEGAGPHRVRAESRQYGPSDPTIQAVRGHWRRWPEHPHHRPRVKVRRYIRHRGLWDYSARMAPEEWLRHLMTYYKVSRREAQAMERKDRQARAREAKR